VKIILPRRKHPRIHGYAHRFNVDFDSHCAITHTRTLLRALIDECDLRLSRAPYALI